MSGGYEELRAQIAKLSLNEKRHLMQDLAEMIQQQGKRRTRSILDLKGLGAEHWKGIDAQEYVDRERDSWSG